MSTATLNPPMGGIVMPADVQSDGYDQIRQLIDGTNQRPMVLREDGTAGVARKHHLKPEKVIEILREWHRTGEFVSPYSRGVYTYTLIACVKLGVNEAHSVNAVHNKMKAMMPDEDWKRFTMENPDAKHHLKPKAKIWQNARQFVRFGGANPYGLKLSQIGCVVDRFEVQVEGTLQSRYIRLNTYAFRGFKTNGDAKVISPAYMCDLPSVESIPCIEEHGEWTMGPKSAMEARRS